MKKIFLIFGFLITLVVTGSLVYANGNYLHTITLEKNNIGYNIILGSDSIAKVSKKSPSDNELILELSGITSSDTVNALYKGTNNIDNLVVENTAPNKMKIYITAENVKNSSVIMEPANGESTIVGETIPKDMLLWFGFVLALLAVIFRVSKKISEEDDKLLIKKSIKDREIEMYKRYLAEISSDSTSINSTHDMSMKKIMKKIDRRIDERLSASLR